LGRLPSASLQVASAALRPAHRPRGARVEPTKGFHPCWFSRPVHWLRDSVACPASPDRYAPSSLRSVQPLCYPSG